jgi:hypothetical protein
MLTLDDFIMFWTGLSVALTLTLNIRKFPVMIRCFLDEEPYPIFPWSEKPIYSNSHPIWLVVHLFWSLILVVEVGLKIVTGSYYDPICTGSEFASGYSEYASCPLMTCDLDQFYKIWHYVHCAIIFVNAIHFGNFVVWKALVVNITGICLLLWLYNVSLPAYLTVLCSPTYIELFTWIKERSGHSKKV